MGDKTARKGKCKLPSGSPPGDSLVPIDQGLASGTIPHGLELFRVTPISAEAEVREPAVARLWAEARQPF